MNNEEIDEINILRASIKAMHLAIAGLTKQPQFLLIDGNRFFPYGDIGYKTIIRGDSLYFPIAAASVLARAGFLESLENLGRGLPFKLPKGAGMPVLEVWKKLKEIV